mmetsp:Transcript_14732/g.48071  ORF Transcript_14732/g.48071 Transcript_14732/m.48071 type:complete len:155 (+) Transcript_14732:856-1320(+)
MDLVYHKDSNKLYRLTPSEQRRALKEIGDWVHVGSVRTNTGLLMSKKSRLKETRGRKLCCEFEGCPHRLGGKAYGKNGNVIIECLTPSCFDIDGITKKHRENKKLQGPLARRSANPATAEDELDNGDAQVLCVFHHRILTFQRRIKKIRSKASV